MLSVQPTAANAVAYRPEATEYHDHDDQHTYRKRYVAQPPLMAWPPPPLYCIPLDREVGVAEVEVEVLRVRNECITRTRHQRPIHSYVNPLYAHKPIHATYAIDSTDTV